MIPAAATASTTNRSESGVTLAGLMTTVQPAARAGAILRVAIASGKFHGVMAPQTPIGCRIASRRASARWVGMVSP